LERQQKLTTNQWKIISAAILGDMLDFFDYGLIAFALAFIVGHWKLTYGQSAVILLAAGIGAVPGALVWGWLADRIGRRTVFIGTALNFSIFTGIMALTPDAGGWIFLSVCRLFVGAGVSGLFAVDLPLVQEFVPSSKRGWVGGIVTCCLPLGGTLAALLGAYLEPYVGWRGLFAIGLLPALLTLLIRAWVPESPRWLMRMGRPEEPQIACLGLADRCERHRAAQRHFRGAKDIMAGAVQISAQHGGHRPDQSRLADRRQRNWAMGADPACAAAEDPTGRGVFSIDFRRPCRVRRAAFFLLYGGRNRPAAIRYPAQLGGSAQLDRRRVLS
jgi:MFS family permease